MATDPTPEGERPSQPGPVRTAWRAVRVLCVVAALAHPVASIVGRHFWLADLISHFQAPAVVASLIAISLTVVQHRRVALGLAFLAVVQIVPLFQYSGANPVPPDPKSPERLRVLMINVLFDNWMHDDVAYLIRTEKPDVVGLVEFTPAWRVGLEDVRKSYPYRMEYPAGTSGLALWFRKPPLTLDQPEWLVEGRNPVIHATFEFAGRERQLWLVHPTSPLKLRTFQPGNPEIDAIALRVKQTGGSKLVLGDMNSTEGSAHFQDFLSVSGLRDSRLGFGRQGSWPTDMPYRISIDHLFLTDDLAVIDRRLGFNVGSDHFPLVVELAPAAATNEATQSAQASTSDR
jgi:endonuclease/exonuclease/phosphatase (EEP) superfamily protein YafD